MKRKDKKQIHGIGNLDKKITKAILYMKTFGDEK
jgi:hypothetical protein